MGPWPPPLGVAKDYPATDNRLEPLWAATIMDSHVPLEPRDGGTTNCPAENSADGCLATPLPATHASSEDDILLVDSSGAISPFNQNLQHDWKIPHTGRTLPINQRFARMWQVPEELAQRLVLRNALRGALDRAELAVYWQPQARVETGRIFGAEALVRWLRPGRDAILPGDFLPLAEEEELIVGISEWVLHQACAYNRQRQEAGLPLVRVSVNLAGDQLRHPYLADLVSGILSETGLDPAWLEVEVAETATARQLDQAPLALFALRQMGVRVSLDDFGSGYFSVAHLIDLPIDALKIDRALIKSVTSDPKCATVTSAIVAMAKKLGLEVIAEGVETAQQLAFLREQGCDAFQGYLLSPALPTRQFDAVLEQHGRIGEHEGGNR